MKVISDRACHNTVDTENYSGALWTAAAGHQLKAGLCTGLRSKHFENVLNGSRLLDIGGRLICLGEDIDHQTWFSAAPKGYFYLSSKLSLP